ncbi:unnamed protein product [Dicrocoelium dendriticum]|nr:unnamed protein product [Dicrocoelium dendriticum]
MPLLVIALYLTCYRIAFATGIDDPCIPFRVNGSTGRIELFDYKPNMFCSTLLTAPNSQGIYMYFLELDLEDYDSVLFDYMVMFEGADCLAPRFAVTFLQRIISSPATNVSLVFISDMTNQGVGLSLYYEPETEVDAWKLLKASE